VKARACLDVFAYLLKTRDNVLVVLVMLVYDFMFGSLWVGDFDDGRYGCVKELFRCSSALTDWEVVVVCQPSPCLEVTNWLDCVTNTIREHEIAEQSIYKICVVHKMELVTLGPSNTIQIVTRSYEFDKFIQRSILR
jgi:hypothetical protein